MRRPGPLALAVVLLTAPAAARAEPSASQPVFEHAGVLAAAPPADAQLDPFVAMNALRVTAPALAPDVTFQALDGRQARLATLRGRLVLLTFFTTW